MNQLLHVLFWMAALPLGQIHAQATAAALHQNILYAGIENPVDITSVQPFNNLRLAGGSAVELTFNGEQHAQLSVLPDDHAQTVSIALRWEDGPVHSAAVFRVRPLPAPSVVLRHGQSGDTLASAALNELQLRATVLGIDFDVPLLWQGFQLATTQGAEVQTFRSESDQLTPAMREAIRTLPSGGRLEFRDMQLHLPGGVPKQAASIVLYKR
jgi:hypothetical protein